MPATHLPPACRRQKEANRSDRAFVVIDGRRIKLGVYGSKESKRKYNELIASLVWAKDDSTAQREHHRLTPPTISELLVAFLKYAKGYYDKRELGHFIAVARIMQQEAGAVFARDFGPNRLLQVRDAVIAKGWSRKGINRKIVRVRQIISWGISREMMPAVQLEALNAVRGLRVGKSKAKEKPDVPPVPDAVIDTTLPHLPPVVADMVKVHRLVGCRPDEICGMRPDRIDRSGEVWIYTPASHKTEWRGKRRQIAIGPRAKAILTKHLFGEFCFLAMPNGRTPGRYSVASYRQAVTRAAKRAGVEHWTPGRIRHTTATEARRVAGLDGAQAICGHATAKTTELYAELQLQKAIEVARRIG